MFCDTDSLAIAKPENIDHETFIRRALAVCDWFKPLNPYGEPDSERASILQVEEINYRADGKQGREDVEPLYCLAVSAKRYALFNKVKNGSPIIRKASGHGLGHLLAPYDDPERRGRIDEIGVPGWQEDLWCEIIHLRKISFRAKTRFWRQSKQMFADCIAADDPRSWRWRQVRGQSLRQRRFSCAA